VAGTNVFIRGYDRRNEQRLLDSLNREAISIYGEDMYYIPRVLINYDSVYGADDQSVYNQAIAVPIYIENTTGFTGDGSFMAKFGIEVRDRTTFSISRTVFEENVKFKNGQLRPNESDLIYFPLNKKCFQIKYVEKFETFYPLGALYLWRMQCELFEYSNETINTGIAEIDSLRVYSTVVSDFAIKNQDNAFILTEDGDFICIEDSDISSKIADDDSEEIEKESSDIIDFSITDPFSDGHIGTLD